MSEQVKARIEALDLEKQVVTEQTVNATKSTRTTLRKEFEQLEEARKLIKSKIEEPYKKFEEKYKELLKVHYEEADVTLREKITAFEGQLKETKAAELKEYFDELCAAKGIDFLSFKGLRLNVTLSEPVQSNDKRGG